MLNIINFLVFRVTRTVLYSLDTCLAAPNATLVVSTLHSLSHNALCKQLPLQARSHVVPSNWPHSALLSTTALMLLLLRGIQCTETGFCA